MNKSQKTRNLCMFKYKLLCSRKKLMQGIQQWQNNEVNLMEWCGYVLWEYYIKRTKKKLPKGTIRTEHLKYVNEDVCWASWKKSPKILMETLYLESDGALFPETFPTKQHKYNSIVFEAASVFSFLQTEETRGRNFEEQQQCGLQPVDLGLHGLHV